MFKKRLYMVAAVLVLLSLTILLFACSGTDEEHGTNDYVENTPSSSITGTAKLVIASDRIESYAISGGKFNINEASDSLYKPGYIYQGIYDSPQGGALVVSTTGEFLMVLETDIFLYPRWEAMDFTLHFSTEHGRMEANDEALHIKAGALLPSELPSPLFDEGKYEFLGWAYNDTMISDKNTPMSEYKALNFGLENSSGTIELTACFGNAKMKVIFDYNDGSYEQVVYETEYGAPFNFTIPSPAEPGREVKYWSETPSGAEPFRFEENASVTRPLTLYAIWSEYKEAEFCATAESIELVKFYKGDSIEAPVPQRDGYEFDGWYLSETFAGNPVSNFSYGALVPKYYAKWTLLKYELKLYEGNTVKKTYTYTVEDSLTFPMDLTEPIGYSFAGWQDEAGTVFTHTKPAGTFIKGDLHAYYTPNKYIITFLDGDEVLGTAEIEYNCQLDFPAPEKYGYQCVGYLLNGEPFTDMTYHFTDNIVLEPIFELRYYQMKYQIPGLPESTSTVQVRYGKTPVQPDEPFKLGCDFVGWFLDPAYRKEYTFDAPLDKDTVLYAKMANGNYTLISTFEELQAISKNPSGKYMLSNDINCKGNVWTPIENFSGLLNGGGHKIFNLIISGTGQNTGLFLKNSGTIKNVIFDGIIFSHKTNGRHNVECAGIVTAENEGTVSACKVSNSTIEYSITLTNCDDAETAWARFGGIVGSNTGTVTSCASLSIDISLRTFVESIDREDCQIITYVGGAVGFNEGLVEKTKVTGKLKSNIQTSASFAISTNEVCMGGVVGRNHGVESIIRLCSGDVTITAESSEDTYCGTSNRYLASSIIAGYNRGTIENCLALGKIDATNENGKMTGKFGSITAVHQANAPIYNAYADVDINVGNGFVGYTGGILGETYESAVFSKIVFVGNVNVGKDITDYGSIIGIQRGSGPHSYYSEESRLAVNGTETKPTNNVGVATPLATLQNEEFLINTLYWDPEIWEALPDSHPVLRCFAK